MFSARSKPPSRFSATITLFGPSTFSLIFLSLLTTLVLELLEPAKVVYGSRPFFLGLTFGTSLGQFISNAITSKLLRPIILMVVFSVYQVVH